MTNPLAAVQAAGTATLPSCTYNNGSSGVGATLTATSNGTIPSSTLDGYTAQLDDRLLIFDQADETQNGVYVLTTVGDGSTPWVLTRATDFDTVTDINAGLPCCIINGTLYGGSIMANAIQITTIGTDNINLNHMSFAAGRTLSDDLPEGQIFVGSGANTAIAETPQGGLSMSSDGTATFTIKAVQGTTTNDNASAGNVGEYIYADCGTAASGTVTMTIASPAIITWTGHAFSMNNGTVPIVFSTTGSLPTGITAGTTYWVIPSSISGNTFKVATSIANAFAGTAVNTSGSQSGTHTALPGVVMSGFVNIAAIQLTPGDWDVSGTIFFFPDSSSTTGTGTGAQISNASATNQGFSNGGMITYWPFTWSGAGGMVLIAPIGYGRISISSTTTYYLVGAQNLSAGSSHGYGFVRARRVR